MRNFIKHLPSLKVRHTDLFALITVVSWTISMGIMLLLNSLVPDAGHVIVDMTVWMFGLFGMWYGYRTIQKREQAEQSLVKANNLLQESISSLSEGFTIYDENDKLVMCNEAYLDMYDISRSFIKPGASFEDIIRNGAKLGQYKGVVNSNLNKWVADRLFKHRAADGQQIEQQLDDGRWLLIVEHKTPSGYTVGNRVDITNRKKMEAELIEHRSHLERMVTERTEELVVAKLQAESASITKSAFLANMSHEIRTPMNAILGMAGILRREGVTPTQELRLNNIDTAAKHLLSVINNILDISKIEAGKFLLEKSLIVVDDIVSNVTAMISPVVKEKQLTLLVEVESLPPHLIGDAVRIQQLMLNYANNAVKFTGSGSITLRVIKLYETPQNVTLRFEVEDTGIGLDAGTIERLFNAFEQADNSMTRKYGGTGLGLAINKRLATMMGGSVGVESIPGMGSTFWFTALLDKGETVFAEVTTDRRRVDPEERLATLYKGQRILVTDDEPVNREIAKMLLEDVGLVVDTVEDGEEAVAAVQSNSYIAILMDMQMPHLNGIEATQQIRKLPGYENVPIIAMTANAFAEDKAQCMEAGMTDFLGKPFDPKTLFSTVLRAMTKK